MSDFLYRHIPIDPAEDFASRASAELEQIILDAIEEKGKCIIGLSGGSTPRSVYAQLGELHSIEWEKVTVFLVDERYCDSGSEKSNQNMIRETLLAGVAGERIPSHQIIFPDTSLPLDDCIEDYDFHVDRLMSEGIGVIRLGLGEDGHIASLFPGDSDAIEELSARVVHTTTETFDVRDRISITAPVIESASHQIFFLKGKGKKKIFEEVVSAKSNPDKYPAHIALKTGNSVWVTEW